MKINTLKILFVLLYIFPAADYLNAQPVNELESRYEKLGIQFEKENKILDSLKIIYSGKTEQIDAEKKKENPDNDKIVELMAGSVTVSNKISDLNKKINNIEKEIESIKQQLHRLYTTQIDSLESLKKSGVKNDEKLDEEILFITARNLLIAPRIPGLSFNPEKILKIDLSKTKDAKEKTLYTEYLTSSLNEIDKLVENVDLQISELDQLLTLRAKTKKFLEETEMESNVILQNQSNKTTNENITSGFFEGNGGSPAARDLASNVKTYQLILRQLDLEQLSKTNLNWDIPADDVYLNLDLKDYHKLLKEVKKRLQEFKLVLSNKINYK